MFGVCAETVTLPRPRKKLFGQKVGKRRGALKVAVARLPTVYQQRHQRMNLSARQQVVQDGRRWNQIAICLAVKKNKYPVWPSMLVVACGRVNGKLSLFLQNRAADFLPFEYAFRHIRLNSYPGLRRGAG